MSFKRKSGAWLVKNLPYWIYLYSKNPEKHSEQTHSNYDERLIGDFSLFRTEGIASKLEQCVASGQVDWLKYGPKKNKPFDFSLFVYIAQDKKDGIEDLLTNLGVQNIVWNEIRPSYRHEVTNY